MFRILCVLKQKITDASIDFKINMNRLFPTVKLQERDLNSAAIPEKREYK
jgi:hypothetical protein